MNLQDAIEQYADMVKLGSEAVRHMMDGQLICPQRAEISEMLAKLQDLAERLKSICQS